MKTFVLSALLSTLAVFASAAAIPAAEPHAEAAESLVARDTQFTYWNDAGFSGRRGQTINPISRKCYNLSSNFNDQVSSVGPSQGLTCVIWADQNCGGASLTVRYPGVSNLNDYGFNDKMSSWYCY